MMKHCRKFARNMILLFILILIPAKECAPLTKKESLINHLFDIGVFKFGNFTLKSGKTSPFYIDMRAIVSHPLVLAHVIDCLSDKIKDYSFEHICGVPYSGLVIASALAYAQKKPMLIKRKETKEYGSKKIIEGVYQKGDRCLIIEDVITTGQSILETTKELETQDLIIKDVVVLIDREQSGMQNVAQKGHQAHALLTISEIAHHLYKTNRITHEQLKLFK